MRINIVQKQISYLGTNYSKNTHNILVGKRGGKRLLGGRSQC